MDFYESKEVIDKFNVTFLELLICFYIILHWSANNNNDLANSPSPQ